MYDVHGLFKFQEKNSLHVYECEKLNLMSRVREFYDLKST